MRTVDSVAPHAAPPSRVHGAGERSARWPALDGLRGLAVLLVVAAHFGVPYTTGAGATGVLIFFVLSGFLITGILTRPDAAPGRLGRFYGRRVRRLIPALVVVVASTVLLSVAFGASENVIPQAVRALLYHANLVEAGEPLGHAWTLSAEEQFYLAWPLLLSVTSPALSVPLGGLLLGPWGLSVFGAIACGAALAWRRTDPLPAWTAAPAGAVILLAAMVPFGPSSFVPVRLAVVASTLVLIRSGLGRVSLLETAPLRYLGAISYGLYLWHVPVRWAFTELGVDPIWTVWTVPAVAVAVGIAALSWKFVEQPVLNANVGNLVRAGRAFRRGAGAEAVHVDS